MMIEAEKSQRSAVCKLETQECWCCSSSPNPKAWDRGGNDVSPSLRPKAQELEAHVPEGKRRWIFRQSKEQVYPSSAFLICSGPQRSGWGPPTQVRAIFIQSVDSVSSRNTLQTHPALWASLAESRWHIKLTVTDSVDKKHMPSACYMKFQEVAVSRMMNVLTHFEIPTHVLRMWGVLCWKVMLNLPPFSWGDSRGRLTGRRLMRQIMVQKEN